MPSKRQLLIKRIDCARTWIPSIAICSILILRNCVRCHSPESTCTPVWCVVNTFKVAVQIPMRTRIRWPKHIMCSWIYTIWSFTACRTITKSSVGILYNSYILSRYVYSFVLLFQTHRWMTSSTCWIRRSIKWTSLSWTVNCASRRAPSMDKCIIRASLAWTTSRTTTIVMSFCRLSPMLDRCVTTFCAKKATPTSNVRQAIQFSIWCRGNFHWTIDKRVTEYNAINLRFTTGSANWCERCGIHAISRLTSRRTKCCKRSYCGATNNFKLRTKAIRSIFCRGFCTQRIALYAVTKIRIRRSSTNRSSVKWRFTAEKFRRPIWMKRKSLYCWQRKIIRNSRRRRTFYIWPVTCRHRLYSSMNFERISFLR